MSRFWLVFVAAGLLAIAAIAPAAAQDSVTIDLDEIDGSGVSGTATLTSDNGETTVSIEIEGGPEDGVHPVHIHDGTCEDLGGVAYPLDDIEDSTSESTVVASLDDLMAAEYAINIHLSADEMATWVACGNIPMAEAEDDDAVTEDDDEAVDDEDDDAATDDDAADDAEDVVPAAGSTGGISPETVVMLMLVVSAAALGIGLAVRRRAYPV